MKAFLVIASEKPRPSRKAARYDRFGSTPAVEGRATSIRSTPKSRHADCQRILRLGDPKPTSAVLPLLDEKPK